MKNKIIPLGTAGILAAGFLYLVLFSNGCTFNLLPYLIHDNMYRHESITMKENTFVDVFDVLFAALLFWIVYRLIRLLMDNKSD